MEFKTRSIPLAIVKNLGLFLVISGLLVWTFDLFAHGNDEPSFNRRRLMQTKKWTPALHLHKIRGDSDMVVVNHRAAVDVPSYVGICSALLDTVEEADIPTKSVNVREEELVCSGKLGITESLTRIFISSWLVAQGRAHFRLRIDYQPSCSRFENHFIHSLLPQKPVPRSRYLATERDEAVMFCRNALISKTVADREQLEIILSRQVKMIEASIDAAVDSAKQKGFIPSGGIFQTLNTRKANLTAETAVIHLPCIDYWCNNILVLPFHVYLTNIPRSVRAIDVVVPPECQGHYRDHALDLIGTLRKFNPRTKVEFLEGYPAESNIFVRFMSADYVFCGPGYGMACIFPLLAQAQASSTQFRILDHDTAKFLQGMQMSEPIDYEVVQTVPPQSFKYLQSQPEGFRSWAYSQPGPAGCRELRGRFGRWVKDDRLAAKAQYKTPLLHLAGAADLKFRQEQPNSFRSSTTYKWQEILYPSCQINPIGRAEFCQLMEENRIRRIFFIGDSLSLQMALSLWMLLKPDVDIPLDEEHYMKRTVQCPGSSLNIEFVRNDELLENEEPVSLKNQVKNCHHYCFPWRKAYMQDPARTLLIANVGAHLHSRELFHLALPRFMIQLDEMQRVNDLVFLRTLVPGHKNCGAPGLIPYTNFGEYATAVEGQSVKDTYNWNVLSSYNDEMARMLDERKRLGKQGAKVELLDVFPMTVLRPDGHIADEFRVIETRKTDCLHYSLPGPPDWWNHLLFTQVRSILQFQ